MRYTPLFGLSLLFLAACELGPIEFPTINDFDLFGPCETDADCDAPKECVYSEYDETSYCLTTCWLDEDCDSGICGELVGGSEPVCVPLSPPENNTTG